MSVRLSVCPEKKARKVLLLDFNLESLWDKKVNLLLLKNPHDSTHKENKKIILIFFFSFAYTEKAKISTNLIKYSKIIQQINS